MRKSIYAVLSFIVLTTFYSNCSRTGFQTVDAVSGSASSLSGGATTVTPTTDSGSTDTVPVVNSSYTPFALTGSEDNVMKVTVGCGYVNQPCVDVTICQIGSSTNCQTIKNLLLDTGSYGLRVFKSALSLSLSALQNTSGQSLAECVGYADGTSQWGPVKVADIILGTQRASQVPMQVIDDTFPTGKSGNAAVPSDCTNLDTISAGYNGILGVGLFAADCGSSCVTNAGNRLYFACTTTKCTQTTLVESKQVSNPVAFLPQDNNGVILQLPTVAIDGATTASGYLIMGIGTRTDNTASNYTPSYFQTDANGNFKTTFSGTSYTGFIDSGSNGMFFPGPTTLTACTDSSGFYCPTTTLSFSATQVSGVGSVQKAISFSIANANVLLATTNPNMVFSTLGGAMGSDFDWGLPFFLGRSVYVGIEGKVSSLGTGPYWAY